MATPAEELDVDGVKVRLTNPDKVYWPKLGADGTKRKLVEYYLAVASGPMLNALLDRPTHLQRFPDGIEGEEIYQIDPSRCTECVGHHAEPQCRKVCPVDCIPLDPAYVESRETLFAKYLRLTGKAGAEAGEQPLETQAGRDA